MIEQIKKELLKLNIHECDIEDVFEILDKHNNQPDYKNVYEELRFIVVDDYFHRIKELETKYNLGGE